jgi:hypothetical protein
MRRPAPVIRGRDRPNVLEFRDGLEPGRSYQVSVKTMSGKVASWPISANVTLSKYTHTRNCGVAKTISNHLCAFRASRCNFITLK